MGLSSSMRDRIGYLKRQAVQFRALGKVQHDTMLRAEFFDLAEACDLIAANIEMNISVHQRARERTPGAATAKEPKSAARRERTKRFDLNRSR